MSTFENVSTSTNIKVYTAGESSAKTKAEFEALTFVEIGAIAEIQPFGDKREEVTLELYGAGRRIKRAGVRDAGNLGLKVARDSFDAGQNKLRAGFAGGKPNAFKVVLDDRPTGTDGTSTSIYVLGVILSAELEPGGPNNFLMQNFDVALTGDEVEVTATTGA